MATQFVRNRMNQLFMSTWAILNSYLSLLTFQFDQLLIEANHGNTKLLSLRNHLLESIRFRLKHFPFLIQHRKLLDILLVYGQDFIADYAYFTSM